LPAILPHEVEALIRGLSEPELIALERFTDVRISALDAKSVDGAENSPVRIAGRARVVGAAKRTTAGAQPRFLR
jgi:hypothetical protein